MDVNKYHLFDSQLHQSPSWEKLNVGQNLFKPCPVYLFISVCLGGSWVTHTRISERNRTREYYGILHSRFGLHRLGLLSPDTKTQAFQQTLTKLKWIPFSSRVYLGTFFMETGGGGVNVARTIETVLHSTNFTPTCLITHWFQKFRLLMISNSKYLGLKSTSIKYTKHSFNESCIGRGSEIFTPNPPWSVNAHLLVLASVLRSHV